MKKEVCWFFFFFFEAACKKQELRTASKFWGHFEDSLLIGVKKHKLTSFSVFFFYMIKYFKLFRVFLLHFSASFFLLWTKFGHCLLSSQGGKSARKRSAFKCFKSTFVEVRLFWSNLGGKKPIFFLGDAKS